VVTDKRELPDLLGRFGVTDVPTGISGFGRRHRAYVKVQDGCTLRCSFCIIPHVRPNLTSRPIDHVVDEVRRLTARGYREVVLTGIHLGHYGVDWNRQYFLNCASCGSTASKDQFIRLSTLVGRLAELPGDFRIRLSSIEATEVTRELVDVMAKQPEKIAPHLHISMQSGSDSVLRRMRRRWGSRRFIDRCALLKEKLDRPAITTDIIVGFPGETDSEFAETIETARAVGFSKIHIFPFSARRGTPAAIMPNQVPKHVQQERSRALAAVEAELRDSYYLSLLGRSLRVLVETQEDGYSFGTSCRYATVELPAGLGSEGQFVDVIADRICGERIASR
jgi:threonylcarbamoyladenosine tRNA methylthiotransferase MtaB